MSMGTITLVVESSTKGKLNRKTKFIHDETQPLEQMMLHLDN